MKTMKPLILNRGEIDAASAEVDKLCQRLEGFLRQSGRVCSTFSCDLLLREILLNSIDHACKNITHARIKYKISIYNNFIVITVKDPGNGFDWHSWLQKPYDPDKSSGRGLMIIRHYADRFRFNKTGNCISIKKTFIPNK